MTSPLGVIDASMTGAWMLPDEDPRRYAPLRAQAERQGLIAPVLWLTEIANAVIVAERRQRITAMQRVVIAGAVAELDVVLDPPLPARLWSAVVDLALAQRLSVYDASYLELAMRASLPLLTLDGALKRACVACGIAVLDD